MDKYAPVDSDGQYRTRSRTEFYASAPHSHLNDGGPANDGDLSHGSESQSNQDDSQDDDFQVQDMDISDSEGERHGSDSSNSESSRSSTPTVPLPPDTSLDEDQRSLYLLMHNLHYGTSEEEAKRNEDLAEIMSDQVPTVTGIERHMSFQPNYPAPGSQAGQGYQPQQQNGQGFPQPGGFPNSGPMKPSGQSFPAPGGFSQNGAPAQQFNGNNGMPFQNGQQQQASNGYPQMTSPSPAPYQNQGPQPPSQAPTNGFQASQQAPAPGQKPGFPVGGNHYQGTPNMPQQQQSQPGPPQMNQQTGSVPPPQQQQQQQQQQQSFPSMPGPPQQQTASAPPSQQSMGMTSQSYQPPISSAPTQSQSGPGFGGGPPPMSGAPSSSQSGTMGMPMQPPNAPGMTTQAPSMQRPAVTSQAPGIPGMPGQTPGMSSQASRMPGQAPGMPTMPGQAPAMPSFPGQAPGMPTMPGQAPGMGMPGMPGQAPGMPGQAPGMPGQAPGMGMMPGQAPGMPGQAPGMGMMPGQAPGMPGQAPGMPGQAPGMGMPGMPGQAPGMPGQAPGMGMPGMPGQAPGMPGMPGQAPGMPGMPGQAPGMPGMPGQAPGMPGSFPGGMPQQQRQRLDPNMMPSAVAVMEDDSVRAGLFPTGYPHAEPPPLVSTNFWAQDQGNCNPRLMRSTIYVAPASNDMLKSSQIPFAVACTPFAKLHANEYAPPVIDLGAIGPVRCQRCKAYMCPFMEFQDGGRRFRCPFCHASTPVDEGYFAHLDHTGRRTDIEHRPELYLGAYEFVATKQYCKNGLPPKEPAFIFMIDVSYNAVHNGMLHVLCSSLERVLQNLPKESGQSESSIRVGLATFDQAVHFYDLSSTKPSMLVVGDVGEMFVPIVDGLLLPYSEAVAGIRAVLAEIPRLFSQSKTTETMLGPVVNAGMDALKCADRAGKLFIFSTSLPTMEAPGQLKTKNDRALLGTEKEKNALTPQSEFYTKAGEQCVKNGVTVDLFLFPNSFIDVPTISQLTAVTGGSVYKYQYFSPEKDANRFLSDLAQDVSKQIAFDCMVRVRSSAGIRPITFSGSFYMENSTDLEMSSIDQDKAFFAELKHDDKLSDPAAIIQCAVLYTAVTGQRRLRIINLCLPVSSDYNQLYRVADQDTLTTYLLRTAVQLNREKGNKEMRETLAQRSAQILATYREKCSENAPLGQLILPETLKLLPVFVNSIMKNDAVGGGSEMTVDDKSWMIELVRGLGVPAAMRMLYPRVFPVSQLDAQDTTSEVTSLPSAVRASVEYLQNDKAYLIDNGLVLFLWIGLGVPEVWVRDVFGASSVTQMDAESHTIPEKDNSRSRGLRQAIQLLEEGSRKRKLFIIREKDALEPWMRKFLVEDKSCPNSMSYVDFLCHVHREIRNILS